MKELKRDLYVAYRNEALSLIVLKDKEDDQFETGATWCAFDADVEDIDLMTKADSLKRTLMLAEYSHREDNFYFEANFICLMSDDKSDMSLEEVGDYLVKLIAYELGYAIPK